MHALHRILVKLEDKDETIEEIRRFAENETENYYNAYDWRKQTQLEDGKASIHAM